MIWLQFILITFAFAAQSWAHEFTCSKVVQGMVPEIGNARYVVLNMSEQQPKIFEAQMDIINTAGRDVKFLVSVLSSLQPRLEKRLKELNKQDSVEIMSIQGQIPGSSWARDFSPVKVIDPHGQAKLVQFRYIGDEREADRIAQFLADKLNLPLQKINLALDPGIIMADEKGRVFVTDKAVEIAGYDFDNYPTLSSPTGGMDTSVPLIARDQKQVTQVLKEALHAKEIIWLKALPFEIERTGHIDLIAKIINGETAVVADSLIPEAKTILDEAARTLRAHGYTKIVRIMSASSHMEPGIFKSYANSLLLGKRILIPKFNQEADQQAKAAYESLGLTVEFVSGSSISIGGSVHCLTCQY